VQLERGFIELKRSKSKTGQRRLVPITAESSSVADDVCAGERSGVAIRRGLSLQAERPSGGGAAIKWKHNALRHSFASYRLAQIQNANQVALETGHSVKVFVTNYRELVTPEEAKSWFGIVPKVGANGARVREGAWAKPTAEGASPTGASPHRRSRQYQNRPMRI